MMKTAVVAGVFIAAGYWFLMSAITDIALTQVQNYEQQYQQALALTEQLGANNAPSNP